MSQSYADFLESKRIAAKPVGFDPVRPFPAMIKPFQAECTRRALVRGRSALFAGTGLGKSLVELTWLDQCMDHTGKPGILLTPLAVARQFEREAVKFGIPGVKACRYPADAGDARIIVTNYERLGHFDATTYGQIGIDESSIVKAFEGSLRKEITAFARHISCRLAATATPAPNDLIELTNHAELLDILTGKEIIALFFTQDGNTVNKWRLKGHAREAFWRWLATWVTALRSPSDLGFSDDGYVLPELRIREHVADAPILPGFLFPIDARTLQERRQARRASLPSRIDHAVEIVNGKPDDHWVCWCDLNDEADTLEKLIPNSVQVAGRDSYEWKEAAIEWFLGNICLCGMKKTGKVFPARPEGRDCTCGHKTGRRVLISKSSIFGFGLNLQCCHNMIFVGVSDSFEQQYQAIRRCWRFAQEFPVDVHLIASDAEGAVMDNLKRKERQSDEMFAQLVRHMGAATDGGTNHGQVGLLSIAADRDPGLAQIGGDFVSGDIVLGTKVLDQHVGREFTAYCGDNIDVIQGLPEGSIDLSVTSVPFPLMYAYSDSDRDMGNCKSIAEMLEHIRHMLGARSSRRPRRGDRSRFTAPTSTPSSTADGYIGRFDFRGDLIRETVPGDGMVLRNRDMFR